MPIYVYNGCLTSLVWAEYEIPIQTAFTMCEPELVGSGAFQS